MKESDKIGQRTSSSYQIVLLWFGVRMQKTMRMRDIIFDKVAKRSLEFIFMSLVIQKIDYCLYCQFSNCLKYWRGLATGPVGCKISKRFGILWPGKERE